VAYIVVFVIFIHAAITLILSNDFSGIFNNNLVRIEAAIASDAIPSISSLDDLDTDSVRAANFTSFLQFSESAIGACCSSCATVGVITLIEHDSILTIFVASILWSAHALGSAITERICFLPQGASLTNEAILEMLAFQARKSGTVILTA